MAQDARWVALCLPTCPPHLLRALLDISPSETNHHTVQVSLSPDILVSVSFYLSLCLPFPLTSTPWCTLSFMVTCFLIHTLDHGPHT